MSLTCQRQAGYSWTMSPRNLHMQSLYLKPKKAEALDALAAKLEIPKAMLLREAVDDLLVKHKVLKAPRRREL
jgi:ribbon-helix-helix protein